MRAEITWKFSFRFAEIYPEEANLEGTIPPLIPICKKSDEKIRLTALNAERWAKAEVGIRYMYPVTS